MGEERAPGCACEAGSVKLTVNYVLYESPLVNRSGVHEQRQAPTQQSPAAYKQRPALARALTGARYSKRSGQRLQYRARHIKQQVPVLTCDDREADASQRPRRAKPPQQSTLRLRPDHLREQPQHLDAMQQAFYGLGL